MFEIMVMNKIPDIQVYTTFTHKIQIYMKHTFLFLSADIAMYTKSNNI